LWQKNSDRSRCDAGKPGTGRRRRKAPSNYGFDPIRPRNVMANCLTEFSRVWAYNPNKGHRDSDRAEIESRSGWVARNPRSRSAQSRSSSRPVPAPPLIAEALATLFGDRDRILELDEAALRMHHRGL